MSKNSLTTDVNPFVTFDTLGWIYDKVPQGHPRPPTILRIRPPVQDPEAPEAPPVPKPGAPPPMEPVAEPQPEPPKPPPPTRVPQKGFTNGACDPAAIAAQRAALQELQQAMLSVKPPADELEKMPYQSKYAFEKSLKMIEEHDRILVKFGVDVVEGTTKCNNDTYIREVHDHVEKLCKLNKSSMRDARRLAADKRTEIKMKCENLEAVTKTEAPYSGFEREKPKEKKEKKGGGFKVPFFGKKAAMTYELLVFGAIGEWMLPRPALSPQKRSGYELGHKFL